MLAMEDRIGNSETTGVQPMDSEPSAGCNELRLREAIDKCSLNFDGWTSLISEIEKTYPDDREKVCLVYDSFLSKFPLCHGYWRKYADHTARLCTVDKVVEIFERAVQLATYCVGLWVDYCNFSMLTFEDPSDIRRLFKRGLSFVGKDYLSHALWDKYMEFELSQRQWNSLAYIYVEALRFPNNKLHHYYRSFKRLGALWKEEMGCHGSPTMDQSEPLSNVEVHKGYRNDQITCIIKELFDPSICITSSKALHKYLSLGDSLYQESCQLDEKIVTFESNIRRHYFHVKSLDITQLENWHRYLDFVEMQGDFDWAVKLYERCLIPCANYPEFWIRYVEFMETKGGREIANYALDRATQTFVKRVPVIHLFNARCKENQRDESGAREAFLHCDTNSDSNFVENVTVKANMERRLGNFDAASKLYEEALQMAAVKKKMHTLPLLYIHFSRLKYMITNSADAARDVLIDGIKHLPHCKLLLEELVRFAMIHGGKQHINIVDSVIANAISPGSDISQGLNLMDAEDVSNLYLEYIDLCGNIDEVRKAWNRHIRLFPNSIRNVYEQSAIPKPSKLTKEVRKEAESNNAMPQQSAGNHNSDCPIQLSLQDKNVSLPETLENVSDPDRTDQVSVQKPTSPENHDIPFEHSPIDQCQSAEPSNEPQRLKSPALEVSEQPMKAASEPEACELHREETAEPNITSDLVCQITKEIECLHALQEHSNGNDVKQEDGSDSGQDPKPLSLAGLSLHPQGSMSPDSVPPVPLKCEASQEASNFDENMKESNCTNNQDGASDSVQIEREVVNHSASRSYQNPVPAQPLPPLVPANIGGNRSQMNNSGKVPRDSKFRPRGRMQRKPHQKWQSSAQQYPPVEIGSSVPMNQGHYPQIVSSQSPQVQQVSQAQFQYQATSAPAYTAAPISWPLQNVLQPNYSSSLSQLSTQAAATQTSHYPLQGEGQQAVQNSQAYNQWWQCYYDQQQQFLLQQQVQLQQQQPLHLSSEQYQQQQLSSQHYQQQQLQQHYPQLQQQQPCQQPQLQQQQYVFHQQQHYMQHVVQPPPLEQRQHQQQNGMTRVHEWNDNCHAQDQGTIPSQVSGVRTPVVSAVSPHSQSSTPPDQ